MPETRSAPNLPSDEILTVREVADYLRLGESTIYRLAQEGKIPARKIGGTWRFSRQAIKIWFRNQQHISTEDTQSDLSGSLGIQGVDTYL